MSDVHRYRLDKRHIASVVSFAVRYIPEADEVTLYRFLELVNVNGSVGWIAFGDILEKMRLMVKHIPGSHTASLLLVIELLDIPLLADEPLSLESGSRFIFQGMTNQKISDTGKRWG